MKAPIEKVIAGNEAFDGVFEYSGETINYTLDTIMRPGATVRRTLNNLSVIMTSEYTEATGVDWPANKIFRAEKVGGGALPMFVSVSGKNAGEYSFESVFNLVPMENTIRNFTYTPSTFNIRYPKLIITKRKITMTPVLPPRGAHEGEILSFKVRTTPTEPGGSGLVTGDRINYRIVTDYTPETPVDTVCSASIELIDTVSSKDKVQYANNNYEITTETITFTVQP